MGSDMELVEELPREKALLEFHGDSDIENELFEGLPNTISHRSKLLAL